MKRTRNYLFVLITINLFLYHKWLNFSIFTYSDWRFYFSDSIVERLTPTVWDSLWVNNFGNVDVFLWRLPLYILTGVFGYVGLDYNFAEKFLFFWPIILIASLGSFFLIRHVLKSNLGALIGSFIFSFNTYFLSLDTQGHQLLTVAFSFSTLSILFFIKILEERKLYLSILNGVFIFVVGFYDLRSLYVTSGILGLYVLYYVFLNFTEVKKDLAKILGLLILSFFTYLLLSFYWILPIMLSGSLTSNSVLRRQIFGSEFYNIQSSLTTFFPFWTGGETAWFTVQNIHWLFWLYPLLAILGLMLNRKNAKVVFFAIIAIIGIFLSKQADVPFTRTYGWLYENFPGFSAFREASKFDYMVSLSYSVLIGSFVAWIWSKKWKGNLNYTKYVVIITIALLSLWNAKPMITGEIKSLFTPHKISPEFLRVKDLVLNEKKYFRSFWINISNNWLIFNNLHPELDGANILREDWKDYFKVEYKGQKRPEGEKIINTLKNSKMDRLLDLTSVKYVIFPLNDKAMGNDIVKGFGKDHKYYKSELSRISYLKRVDNMPTNILVYENSNFRPHIYSTRSKESIEIIDDFSEVIKVEFIPKSPSEYKIAMRNVSEEFYLNFTDSFHPNWKLRLGNFSWTDVLLNNDYFLHDKNHLRSDSGLNTFSINPKDVCKKFECKRNQDGSYDIEMTLYFAPQSHLYLGMIISGTTLVMCLGYLIYYGIKKTKAKN